MHRPSQHCHAEKLQQPHPPHCLHICRNSGGLNAATQIYKLLQAEKKGRQEKKLRNETASKAKEASIYKLSNGRASRLQEGVAGAQGSYEKSYALAQEIDSFTLV